MPKLVWCLKKGLLVGLFLCFSQVCFAKDLGVIGQTYPIIEVDFLDWIKNKLFVMQQNGELSSAQQQLLGNTKEYMVRPKPVVMVTKATENRSFTYDPSVVVPYDITDHLGNIIYRAGTRVNPLQKMPLSKALLFFDGDDVEQCHWVQQMDSQLKGKDKLILVKGDVIAQQKVWQRVVYFDQQGLITKRLDIQHAPAIVTQQDHHLFIREIKLPS